jgi:hypothetical protein
MTLSAYLSKVLNKKPEELKIYVHAYLLGGGFGGKQDYDDILAAAYCSKEVGRPVKLIQTRESQFATSYARTPTYHKLKGGLKYGKLVSMNHDIVCGWMGPRFFVGKKYGTIVQLDSWDAKKQDIDQWSIGGRSLVRRTQSSCQGLDTIAHLAAGKRAARPTATTCSSSSRSWTRWHTLQDAIRWSFGCHATAAGGNRGIPNTGYAPGTRSDYYMDRLWISLPWPNSGSPRTSRGQWAARCVSRTACESPRARRAGAREAAA